MKKITLVKHWPDLPKLEEGRLKAKRVAVYARVSTDHEEQKSSLDAQKDYYTKLIKKHAGWTLAGVYADEGISGTSYRHREAFKQMMADCGNGKVDMIVTKSISRFARNTVDALRSIRKLKEMNIGVFFEKENIWTLDSKGEFLLTLMTSLAQEESRSLSENVTWGHRKRFADGKYYVAYSRFLGYDAGFVVNPKEAAVVKLIYKMFLQGYEAHTIANKLTRNKIPTPGGGSKWESSVVRSILQNEKYKGDALLQKTFITDFLTKKSQVNRGELPKYYVANGHEAIIAPQLFDYVQEVMKKRITMGKWAVRYSGMTLYTSKFVCGKCGAFYGPRPEHSTDKYRKIVWMCHNRFKKEKYCKNTRILNSDLGWIICQIAIRNIRARPGVLEICQKIVKGNKRLTKKIAQYSDFAFDDMEDMAIVILNIKVYPEGCLAAKMIDAKSVCLSIDEKTTSINLGPASPGTCWYCGKPVRQDPDKKLKKFCSDTCRWNWWNSHLDLVKRKAFRKYTCLNCGKVFEVYGQPGRKYCSHQCYIEHRFGKKQKSFGSK